MYNKFLKELKPLIIISVITLASIAIGFDADLSISFFIWCVTLIVLPICIKDSNLSLRMKLFITVSIGIASVLAINYFIGRQRTFYLYIILFLMTISYSTASSLRSKRD
jgi:hypothetical protein